MRVLSWVDYAVIGAYLVGMALVGTWFARRQTTGETYALGNRRVAWWAAGLSMFATGASAISVMAIPAVTFRTNLVWWFPVLTGVISFFIQAYLIFPLLRRLELTSTFEYLAHRFNLPLRLIASLPQIIFQTLGRVPVVLLLPSMALSATTGLDVLTSVLLTGVVTILDTAHGGFEAVIWTDVVQGLLMIVAPVAMIMIVLLNLPGGAGEFIAIGRTYDNIALPPTATAGSSIAPTNVARQSVWRSLGPTWRPWSLDPAPSRGRRNWARRGGMRCSG